MVMLHQVLEAVRVAFPNSQNRGAEPSAASKDEARTFLTKWQESQDAWESSIDLLGEQNCPEEVLFIAAQTLRTKVLLDFAEMPVAHRSQFRDAVLEKVEKLCTKPAVRTQLCMSVADLVIHMDDQWPDAISTLLARWKTDEYFPLLLEVLEYLPEEKKNKRLLVDQVRRQKIAITLENKALEILQLLHSMWKPQMPMAILRKILTCFHSWLSFLGGDKTPEAIMLPCHVLEKLLDPLVEDCFGCLDKQDLGEPATDIIVEVLRICAINLNNYQSVAQKMMLKITLLKEPLGKLLATELDSDGEIYLKRLCRIFTETGECLISIFVNAFGNPDVQSMIKILIACSNCSLPDISSIPMEQFWFRLAREVADHPDDTKRQEFKSILMELCAVLVKRAVIPPHEDPFKLDDEFVMYRRQLRQVCVDITDGSRRRKPGRESGAMSNPPAVALHPNEAMEFVLRSLQSGGALTSSEQEAHFFILNALGGMTEIRQDSALWSVLTHLPTLINAETQSGNADEQKRAKFTKKTAMLLLGSLSSWVQQKPEFLRSTLSMISTILLAKQGDIAAGGKEEKLVLAEASESFREVITQERGSNTVVLGQVNELCQVYRATLGTMPAHYHLNIVEGVVQTVQRVECEEKYKTCMSLLITPLVDEFTNAEVFKNAEILIGILDRLTTIVRFAEVNQNPARAEILGNFISGYVWPATQNIFIAHSSDRYVVEKTCRLLKHSIRCVPVSFKPMVKTYAERLVTSFESQQHSSYLYAAEILVNTYGGDADCGPILHTMFNSLAAIGLRVLQKHEDFNKATELGELVEDFFGMHHRFLKYAQQIVLTSPTLPHALKLCVQGLFTIQRDAIEAVVALIEDIYNIATAGVANNVPAIRELQTMLVQLTPQLLLTVFELLRNVPPAYVVDGLHGVFKVLREWAVVSNCQEFPRWLNEGLNKLPPSVLHSIDNIQEQLATCRDDLLRYHIQDIAYRCEQVCLRSRSHTNKR